MSSERKFAKGQRVYRAYPGRQGWDVTEGVVAAVGERRTVVAYGMNRDHLDNDFSHTWVWHASADEARRERVADMVREAEEAEARAARTRAWIAANPA